MQKSECIFEVSASSGVKGALIALFLMLVIGCDESEIQELQIESQNQAVMEIAEKCIGGIGEEDVVLSDNDADVDRPIQVTWLMDMANGAVEDAKTLIMEVKSQSKSAYVVEPSVSCYGFVYMLERIALNKFELAPGETVQVEIPVSKIPLQNINGAASLNVKFNLMTTDGTKVSGVSAPPLYYRFKSANFQQVRVMTEKEVINGQNGLLFGGEEAMESNTLLGRIKKENGTTSEVWSNDAAFTVENQNSDTFRATVEQVSISVGQQDGEYEAEPTEDME